MSDTTVTEGADTESTLTITEAELQAKIAEAVKAAMPVAEPVESEQLIAARKLIAEADGAPIVTEAAPEPGLTPEVVQAMIAEAVKTTTATVLDAARKEIQESGPRRRGLVLEQAPEEIYGDRDLTKLSTAELNKLTDEVAFPLIAR